MMKQTKRMFVLFSFYDRTGIEHFLEEQAAEGWLLKKTSAFGLVFRRIPPQKLHFCVTYFPSASAFDPEPADAQLRFRELCEHTGWKLASADAQMQIFYSELPDPVPIETDAAMEVENIHASVKKSYLSVYLLHLILAVMQLGLQANRFRLSPVENLASTPFLLTCLCWLVVLAMLLVEVGGYYRWYRKAKKAAALDGSFVATRGRGGMQLLVLLTLLAALAFLLVSYGGSSIAVVLLCALFLILAVTGAVIAVSSLLKRRKASAKLNRTVTILTTVVLSFGIVGIGGVLLIGAVHAQAPDRESTGVYYHNGRSYELYADELPLYLDDLAPTGYDGYSTLLDHSSSPLAAHTSARQRTRWDALEQPELEYTVTVVRWRPLYSLCKKALLDNFAHNYGRPVPDDPDWESRTTVDAAPWGAQEAYQLLVGGEAQQRYLLCFADRIVEIDFEHDWLLTDAQKAVVAEKLCAY